VQAVIEEMQARKTRPPVSLAEMLQKLAQQMHMKSDSDLLNLPADSSSVYFPRSCFKSCFADSNV
jgi:hypothetical protein